MALPLKHTFTIADKINPFTEKPFGDAYAGNFAVHRPNLSDQQMIAVKEAAVLSAFGFVDPDTIDQIMKQIIKTFAKVAIMAEKEDGKLLVPEWFNPDKMYEDDDKAAVMAVGMEVTTWLASFRSPNNPPAGGAGG